MASLRVVLDTNVIVSGLAYPASIPGRIVSAWREGGLEVTLSRYIVDEVRRVLPRLSHIRRTPGEIEDLIDSMIFLADIVDPNEEKEPTLRDPADQKVLATLLASTADYLITGDKDLLALAEKYSIVTPAAFWARHG